MRVDHARIGAAHGVGDVVGRQAALQQPPHGAAAPERGGVALEHLDVLVEVLADQPREIGHRPLLAAGQAVAVVQEQDHSDEA